MRELRERAMGEIEKRGCARTMEGDRWYSRVKSEK